MQATDDVHRNILSYKRGATLLLRDSLKREDASVSAPLVVPPSHSTAEAGTTTIPESTTSAEALLSAATSSTSSSDQHVCITDYKATVREAVGPTLFEFPAGSFFQNNNSVLQPLVEYVRDAIFPPGGEDRSDGPTHLVDTYCGAGFFALSLAPYFVRVSGVEISVDSINSARKNAQLNNLPPPPTDGPSSIRTQSVTFSAGKSESIFESVSHFPASRTVVIIDPPRKGCDEAFLLQLVKFKPATLVYVSCNVHTQARDVGTLKRLMAQEEGEAKRDYTIRSLRGFDLFPQTSHVESVAVLSLT